VKLRIVNQINIALLQSNVSEKIQAI